MSLIKITEADLREQVRDAAGLFGWEMHFTWLSMHSPKGYPDLFLAHPEKKRILWAELKGEKGKLTPDQERWIQILRDCGQEVHVWRPSDFDLIVETLRK
jgi:hypothetical protein